MPNVGEYLLDTSIVVDLLKGDNTVIKRLAECQAVYLSAISIGELLYGALKSTRAAENTERINQLASTTAILPVTDTTAESYSLIKNR